MATGIETSATWICICLIPQVPSDAFYKALTPEQREQAAKNESRVRIRGELRESQGGLECSARDEAGTVIDPFGYPAAIGDQV